MSKLYTEEQLRFLGRYVTGKNVDAFIATLTPIELPTDEEIEDKSNKLGYGSSSVGIVQKNFQLGAKWMRDKIGQ